MSLCHGQLAIANLLKGDIEQAQNDFTECIRIARDLKAVRMQLECLLCMAYISFNFKNWQQAKYFFDEAYNVSFICFLRVLKFVVQMNVGGQGVQRESHRRAVPLQLRHCLR